jgi:hypothetical protein
LSVKTDDFHLARRALLAKKGIFLLIGRPGSGKSFEAARTFQRSFSLLSSVNNQHFYDMWLASDAGKASGKTPPVQTVLQEVYQVFDPVSMPTPFMSFAADGLPQPQPQKQWFEHWVMQLFGLFSRERAAGQPLTFQNIIIDELGTFMFRIKTEMEGMSFTKDGKINPLGAWNMLSDWTRQMIAVFRHINSCGANVVLIAHDRDPDPAKDKQGGAHMPSADVQKLLSADVDGTLIREIIDEKPKLVLNLGLAPPPPPTAPPVPLSAFAMPQAKPPTGPGFAAFTRPPSGPPSGSTLDESIAAAAGPGISDIMSAAKGKPAKRCWRIMVSQHWQSKLRGVHDSMFDQLYDRDLDEILPLAGFAP